MTDLAELTKILGNDQSKVAQALKVTSRSVLTYSKHNQIPESMKQHIWLLVLALKSEMIRPEDIIQPRSSRSERDHSQMG